MVALRKKGGKYQLSQPISGTFIWPIYRGLEIEFKKTYFEKPKTTLQSTESATYCELLTKSWREARLSSENRAIKSKMIVLIVPVTGY